MPAPTPSQTVGPFFGFALPFPGDSRPVTPGRPGAIRIEGQVLDGKGDPVPDAILEIWQAGPDGSYAEGSGLFGRCRTDPEGVFAFTTLKPGRVALPDGRLQAPHLNLTVFARGLLKHLVSRVYFPDEAAANAEDPVLAAAGDHATTLVARPDGDVLHFDVRLQGDGETAFFAI